MNWVDDCIIEASTKTFGKPIKLHLFNHTKTNRQNLMSYTCHPKLVSQSIRPSIHHALLQKAF